MSSINSFYTFNYSQPEEYRFSHDSVFLARTVFEMLLPSEIATIRGLDLCSGCGIIGLDFLFHCRKEHGIMPPSFDFLEVQRIYEPHFAENTQRLGPRTSQLRFINENYTELKDERFKSQYDLVLCNPPYFQKSQGTLSPSEFKNRCRFFLDSDFENLILGIANALSKNGRAYLLLRDLPQSNFSYLKQAQRILGPSAIVDLVGDIRGTQLVKIGPVA